MTDPHPRSFLGWLPFLFQRVLFPGAIYENRFGTVAVRHLDRPFEITTFRTDHDYADHRRPDRVEFGTDIAEDLARRDFTVNALAWGGRSGEPPGWLDPHHGIADLERRVLRAVGDPGARFDEDALRMIRAVRLSATLDFSIDRPAAVAVAVAPTGFNAACILAKPCPQMSLTV